MYDLTLATKALLLNNSIKVRESILASGDEQLIAMFQKLVFMKEELLAINRMSQEELSHLDVSLDKFQKDILQLEKKVNEKAGNYTSTEKVTWQSVKSVLKKDEYAVEIIRFHTYHKSFTDSVVYAALILDNEKKKSVDYVLFPNGISMENEYFKYYRNTRTLFVEDTLSYKRYWEPLASKIATNSTVYFSADGIYSLMNPETFRVEEGGAYVIDHYSIHTVTNTKEIVKKINENHSLTKTATIVSNPTFYPEDYLERRYVRTLPGTASEAIEIAKVVDQSYKLDVLQDESAMESLIKQIDNPSILHFATHGYFKPITSSKSISSLSIIQDNSLLKSGLVLNNGGAILDHNNPDNYNTEDGLLTAYEVLNMKLDNTDLVVLSACETGLGTGEIGEGVYGLQKAFLVAGADRVIMSVFKVSDQITVEFMKTYYEQMLLLKDERKALIETKKMVRLAHPDPFYWGSFVMIGQ